MNQKTVVPKIQFEYIVCVTYKSIFPGILHIHQTAFLNNLQRNFLRDRDRERESMYEGIKQRQKTKQNKWNLFPRYFCINKSPCNRSLLEQTHIRSHIRSLTLRSALYSARYTRPKLPSPKTEKIVKSARVTGGRFAAAAGNWGTTTVTVGGGCGAEDEDGAGALGAVMVTAS